MIINVCSGLREFSLFASLLLPLCEFNFHVIHLKNSKETVPEEIQ